MTRAVRVLRNVLCVYLLTFEPVNVATVLLRVWPTLGARGGWAAAEMILHLVVATLAVTGATALWSRSPHGAALAALGIAASTGRTLQIARYSWLPHGVAPGMAEVLAAIALVHAVFWLAFLTRFQDQLADRPATGDHHGLRLR